MNIIIKILLFLLFLYWYISTKKVSVLLMTIFFFIDAIRVIILDKFISSNITIVINIIQLLCILGALIFFIESFKNNNSDTL